MKFYSLNFTTRFIYFRFQNFKNTLYTLPSSLKPTPAFPFFDRFRAIDTETGFNIRSSTNPQEFLNNIIINQYSTHLPIYTDGSYVEAGQTSASSFYIPSMNISQGTRLMGCYSAFGAELSAIHSALKFSLNSDVMNPLIITDSLRSLNTIRDRFQNPQNNFLNDGILSILFRLEEVGCQTTFLWVPSHSKILGNERADSLARLATKLPFGKKAAFSKEDFINLVNNDYKASIKINWPFFPEAKTSQSYFNYIYIYIRQRDHGLGVSISLGRLSTSSRD